SSSEQSEQVIKSDNKTEQVILPIIPIVLDNDEIESNFLSVDTVSLHNNNEDKIISKELLSNVNKHTIQDDSQLPKCPKCNGDLSSWDCIN
ncbi:7846_t:CDS:1, partial [Cetraspora pellucida]